MNDAERPTADYEPPEDPHDNRPAQGPNLFLLYGLFALALAAAIGLALLIVMPFYQQR